MQYHYVAVICMRQSPFISLLNSSRFIIATPLESILILVSVGKDLIQLQLSKYEPIFTS